MSCECGDGKCWLRRRWRELEQVQMEKAVLKEVEVPVEMAVRVKMVAAVHTTQPAKAMAVTGGDDA